MIWELDGIMGVTGVQGSDMFSSINFDFVTYRLILFTVCFITVSQMIAQILTLNRAHLAMHALQSVNAPSFGDNNTHLSRRGTGNVAQKSNISNNTDDWYTPPNSLTRKGFIQEISKVIHSTMDIFWKQTQRILSDEYGHMSSSRVIAVCSQLHALYAMVLILMCLVHLISGKTSFALMIVFIAIFNSAGCMDIGLPNTDEFISLAQEIKM
jgi:hypothetical protein